MNDQNVNDTDNDNNKPEQATVKAEEEGVDEIQQFVEETVNDLCTCAVKRAGIKAFIDGEIKELCSCTGKISTLAIERDVITSSLYLPDVPSISNIVESNSGNLAKSNTSTYFPIGYTTSNLNDILSFDENDWTIMDNATDGSGEDKDLVSLSALDIPSIILDKMEDLFPEENNTLLKYGPLIGAIDEGTSSTRFLVFASKTAEVLTYHQIPIESIVPQEGWFEQDPKEILNAVIETIKVTCDNLGKLNINVSEIAAIGITNQRETTIVWDSLTGEPLYNAIVWMDTRTHSTVDEILKFGMRNQNFLQQLCGLPVSTYFSALKIKWLMDNVPHVKEAIEDKRCLFGTVDTWLIWNLTGGVKGGIHITDCTNASRTMLMNIETLDWDPKLCEIFGIPMHILPTIKSSSEIYACIYMNSVLDGVPISGILGDQQAALVGEMCFNNGQAKCTYGTGCFILYNTGPRKVLSSHGLLTTVAYQFGPKTTPIYALEGSVAIAGIGIKWLRDNLEILKDVSESTDMALSVGTEGEVVFVPAFSGLYAPYWRKDARSVICGLTEETKPGHLVKAALEAVCFQVRDVLEAMTLDCNMSLNKLLVDGGMTVNDYLMQMQSDYCGIPVVRPTLTETTSFGAAVAAGIAKGIAVWELDKILPVPCDTFNPLISEDVRNMKYSKWKMGIERSIGWVKSGNLADDINLPRMVEWDDDEAGGKIAAAAPAGLFLLGAAVFIAFSEFMRRRLV
ncbi:unnamed protein product [Phyllotreta striolata]|uniref:Probable glycerol kinase n=1 Tax=Phyllotreta striolata TaxID=444603 RepID=A0A9N9TG21_PHYSR|nr:unnamed protein product [Phyllotreta striolata]